MHILELFKPYIYKNFKLRSRSHNIYSSISFSTLTLPCFTYYNELFYNSDNRKIVPLNIAELLTRLAYWIMDDGSLQNKGLHLSVYAC